MGAASFAIFILWALQLVNLKYITSFVLIEISFILGFFSLKQHNRCYLPVNLSPLKNFINLFSTLTNILSVIVQIVVFYKIGLVAFNNEVNHVSAYDGEGILRALITSLQQIFYITFFYKRIISSLKWFDYTSFLIIFFGTIVSGSKSSILIPITIYFIIEYYFKIKNNRKMASIKWGLLVCVVLFPLIILSIQQEGDFSKATIVLLGRIVASGDIYVMGYNDTVIKYINETSFIKYILYPGWGTILKTLGFPITPPSIIGVDIWEFYNGNRIAGPNTRLNFLLYYFWGISIGSIIAFFIGRIVSYVRYIYGRGNYNFFKFMIMTLLYYNILNIIVDISLFLNVFFWATFFFIIIYFTSLLFYKLKIFLIQN